MNYPSTWRDDRSGGGGHQGGNSDALRGGAEATLAGAGAVASAELGWAAAGGGFAELALEGALIANARRVASAIGSVARPVLGGVGRGGLLGAAVGLLVGGYIGWRIAEYIRGMAAGGNWSLCCTATYARGPTFVKTGVDYRGGGGPTTCAAAGITCIGGQADGTPFTPSYAGAQTRILYDQNDLGGGLFRYNHIAVWTRVGTANVDAPPRRPPLTWVLPGFMVPAEHAGDTDYVSATPVPLPWAWVPRAKGLPGSFQTRSAGYDAGENKGGVLAPPITISIGADGSVGVGVTPKPDTIPRAVPTTPEQKVQLTARTRTAFRMMALYSEAGDLVEALYASLPYYVRVQYANTQYGRLQAVMLHIAEVNWLAFGANYSVNQLGDIQNASRLGVMRDVSNQIDPTNTLWRAFQSFGG